MGSFYQVADPEGHGLLAGHHLPSESARKTWKHTCDLCGTLITIEAEAHFTVHRQFLQ